MISFLGGTGPRCRRPVGGPVGLVDRRERGASTGLVRDGSSTCPARNWRFAVVGAGFEEVKLLDAVDYGGPQRSSCGPVSRRVRLGWRSLPSTNRILGVLGVEACFKYRGVGSASSWT